MKDCMWCASVTVVENQSGQQGHVALCRSYSVNEIVIKVGMMESGVNYNFLP